MTDITRPTRRGLVLGLAGLFAAPALVRASSLMAISPLPQTAPVTWRPVTWTIEPSDIFQMSPDGVLSFR